MQTFDIIVIGAGAGGLNVASFVNRVGLSVLLIDRSDAAIGGDCLNFGCVPSKALIRAAGLVAAGREAERFGVRQEGAADLRKVMDYVRERQEVIRRHENAAYLKEKGITVVLGEASFSGRREVTVGGEAYRGRRIVIATGSRPRALDIPVPDGLPVYTNETVFDATMLPEHLVIVGGGPIGFEIGQSFARLGAEVTLVNRDDQWLPKEDRRVVSPLMERMAREGVTFIADATVSEVSEGRAVIKHSGGRLEDRPCDALFVSIGRELALHGLELEKAGIERDESGKPILDPYLRTTNKRVFALGDVVGQHQFTHAAEVHASLLLSNFFKPRLLWKKLDTSGMAWVTYTDPEIATFGRNEADLKKKQTAYEVVECSFAESDRAIIHGRTEGLVRLFVSPKGVILGGTMAGEHAGELVAELILAREHGMTLADIFERVFPYPTAARINRAAAAAFLGKKLTPRTKWLLRRLY